MVEPAGEHFAVIGQDLLRRAIDGERGAQPVADRLGAFTDRAHTHFRERSSVPVSALALVPIRGNPPTMSICHNSIGARLRYAATLAETT